MVIVDLDKIVKVDLDKMVKVDLDKPFYGVGKKKWTIEEENTLLQELNKNINIENIASTHNRTINEITTKQYNIAYIMYLAYVDATMIKTKLSHEYILEISEKPPKKYWTIDEENTLLQELDKNINIENIALTHNRTIAGIVKRQHTIAYNMYLAYVNETMIKTKLNHEQILQIPDKQRTPNYGKKWTIDEENALLQELDKNINIENIASTHNRTIGAIVGKQHNIAYNMYLAYVNETMIKTKLSNEQILQIIYKPISDKPISDKPISDMLQYPSNYRKKWNIDEENALLQELDKNINIENIALTHNRTIGGIVGKQHTIAYNMYLTYIKTTMIKTKLSHEQILYAIHKKKDMPLLKNKVIKMEAEINKKEDMSLLKNNVIKMDNTINKKEEMSLLKNNVIKMNNAINKKEEMSLLKNKVIKMEAEIKELKITIKKLVEAMKAINNITCNYHIVPDHN